MRTERTRPWYQHVILGKYFAEEIVREPRYQGKKGPPGQSMVRRPSKGLWTEPLASWIGMNSEMNFMYFAKYGPPNTDYKPYWRGPPPQMIIHPPARFVLFQDSRTSGWMYIGNHHYKEYRGDASNSPSTTDMRHDGGANFGFLDGHSKFIPEVDDACADDTLFCEPW